MDRPDIEAVRRLAQVDVILSVAGEQPLQPCHHLRKGEIAHAGILFPDNLSWKQQSAEDQHEDEKGRKQRVQAKRPLKGAVGKEQPEQEGDERQDRKGLWDMVQHTGNQQHDQKEGRCPRPAADAQQAVKEGAQKQKQPDQQSAQQQQLPLRVP